MTSIDIAKCRLSIEVSKAQNNIPSAKRDGDDMVRDVRSILQLDESTSSKRAATVLRQEILLDELDTLLEDDEDSIVAKFEALRSECSNPLLISAKYTVTRIERLRVNVIADVFALSKPVSVWDDFLPAQKVSRL
jgi:Zn-dependent M16 (insulinase) family peptidase